MLGLPESRDVSKLINWSYNNDLFTLAICHGPAALLAASIDAKNEDFIYKGYNIAAFPDAVDAQGPMIGYTPGKMPWIYGEKLNKLGVTIINEGADALSRGMNFQNEAMRNLNAIINTPTVGASGAVSGIVYSSILVFPDMQLLLFFAIPIPGYIFGVGYLLYSIYGMKKQVGNIGHAAHLGGAMGGFILTLILKPELFFTNTVFVIFLAIPIILLLLFGDKLKSL